MRSLLAKAKNATRTVFNLSVLQQNGQEFKTATKSLRRGFPPAMVSYSAVGQPVWTPRSFEQLAKQGYQKNVIVYRCVNLIARSVGSIRWELEDRGQPVEHHPLLDLLQHPQGHQSGSSFLESVVGYLLLAGNSYIECVPQTDGYELHALRPDRIRVVPDQWGGVKGHQYELDGRKHFIPFFDEEQGQRILQLKFFNPLHDWYGMSPLEAAACAIDQHNTVASHNLAILQNGGRPSD